MVYNTKRHYKILHNLSKEFYEFIVIIHMHQCSNLTTLDINTCMHDPLNIGCAKNDRRFQESIKLKRNGIEIHGLLLFA